MEEFTLEETKAIIAQSVEKATEFLSKDKPQIAEIIVKQVLRCDPEHLGAMQIMALAKYQQDRNIEAVEIFQTLLEIDPTNADNYNNLALVYSNLEYRDRAIDNLKKAIEFEPDNALFYNNLALQYRLANKYEMALEAIKKAIEISPSNPQFYVNLGGLFGELKKFDDSIAALEQGVRVDPDYPANHVDLGFAHHLKGNWKKGFEECEWRLKHFAQLQFYMQAYDQTKRWDGEKPLDGKRFMVYCEQGMGDGIMFSRYFSDLKKLGAYVIIHCACQIESVIKRLEGVDETVVADIMTNVNAPLPEYDYHCASMSLPHLLGVSEISGKPWIKAATDRFRPLLEKKYGSESFKIGIVWAGSPKHPHDIKRSIPLKFFKPLLAMEGTQFLSLQTEATTRTYGQGFSQDPPPEAKVYNYVQDCDDVKLVDLTDMIQSFEDTATILAGIDLLISCDTAAVHLAGAMGVPCWMFLPYNPDWRWGMEGDTTMWYDSVRLFRQSEDKSWPEVIEKVKKELHEAVLQNKR